MTPIPIITLCIFIIFHKYNVKNTHQWQVTLFNQIEIKYHYDSVKNVEGINFCTPFSKRTCCSP
jgi:hypothetical protein